MHRCTSATIAIIMLALTTATLFLLATPPVLARLPWNVLAASDAASSGTSESGPSGSGNMPGDLPTHNATSPPTPYPLNTSLQGHSAHISDKWVGAHRRARDYLSSWTQEEKVNLTTGVGWEIGRCVGNIPAIPSQDFPGLCLEDSPLGVRFADFASAFPAGINVAST